MNKRSGNNEHKGPTLKLIPSLSETKAFDLIDLRCMLLLKIKSIEITRQALYDFAEKLHYEEVRNFCFGIDGLLRYSIEDFQREINRVFEEIKN